jgi:hypothetical protein
VPPGVISFVLKLVPLTARSCSILPSFLTWKVIVPALKVVDDRAILNSVSLACTVCAAGFGGAVVVWADVVVAAVVVGVVVVVDSTVLVVS